MTRECWRRGQVWHSRGAHGARFVVCLAFGFAVLYCLFAVFGVDVCFVARPFAF